MLYVYQSLYIESFSFNKVSLVTYLVLLQFLNIFFLLFLFPVLRIRDMLVRIWIRIRMLIQILGDVPLTNGSGCGSGMPKNYGSYGSGTLVKIIKKSQNGQGFSYYICLMMEVSGAGSVLVTSGSGCRSGRPKNK
jgi:hypothetical protein